MLVGYARVSTDDQNLSLQLDALRAAGCGQVHEDRGISGGVRVRAGLDTALASLEAGDVLVVWRLDRLGRSLVDLIEIVASIGQRGCGFRSLTEAIDTTTAAGELMFHLMGALAQFERRLITERTRAGREAAKRRGVKLGRRLVLTDPQIRHARQLVDAGESPTAIARSLEVSRATLYRALARTKTPDKAKAA